MSPCLRPRTPSRRTPGWPRKWPERLKSSRKSSGCVQNHNQESRAEVYAVDEASKATEAELEEALTSVAIAGEPLRMEQAKTEALNLEKAAMDDALSLKLGRQDQKATVFKLYDEALADLSLSDKAAEDLSKPLEDDSEFNLLQLLNSFKESFGSSQELAKLYKDLESIFEKMEAIEEKIKAEEVEAAMVKDDMGSLTEELNKEVDLNEPGQEEELLANMTQSQSQYDQVDQGERHAYLC